MIELTDKQNEIYAGMANSIISENPALVVGGVAGSGKTTIIERVLRDMSAMYINVACCSLTGRAAYNLSRRGLPNVSTIHSLMYEPVYDHRHKFQGFRAKKPEDIRNEYQSIVVEEASMMTYEHFELFAELELPLVFVGDHFQLESICPHKFNIMTEMDYHLDEIHRVAQDNPVIALSGHVRNGGYLGKQYACDQIKFYNKNKLDVRYFKQNEFDIVLCGLNKTRERLNKIIRASKGFGDDIAEVGETVICMKNSNDINGTRMYNGSLYEVMNVSKYGHYAMYSLKDQDGHIYTCKVHENSWLGVHPSDDDDAEQNWSNMEYGYAMTVHKSQGSQFDNMLYIDEDVSWFCDWQRFRYTGITRTSNLLGIAT